MKPSHMAVVAIAVGSFWVGTKVAVPVVPQAAESARGYIACEKGRYTVKNIDFNLDWGTEDALLQSIFVFCNERPA